MADAGVEVPAEVLAAADAEVDGPVGVGALGRDTARLGEGGEGPLGEVRPGVLGREVPEAGPVPQVGVGERVDDGAPGELGDAEVVPVERAGGDLAVAVGADAHRDPGDGAVVDLGPHLDDAAVEGRLPQRVGGESAEVRLGHVAGGELDRHVVRVAADRGEQLAVVLEVGEAQLPE